MFVSELHSCTLSSVEQHLPDPSAADTAPSEGNLCCWCFLLSVNCASCLASAGSKGCMGSLAEAATVALRISSGIDMVLPKSPCWYYCARPDVVAV
jgi:hypothetical protein